MQAVLRETGCVLGMVDPLESVEFHHWGIYDPFEESTDREGSTIHRPGKKGGKASSASIIATPPGIGDR